ncbi:MAG: hypothetical protein ABUL60_29925 [Myxococcales bacterium]
MTPPLRHSLVVAALLAAACAGDPASSDANGGGAGESATTAGSSNGGKGGVPEAECPAANNPHSAPRAVSVGLVSGQLVDEQGEPTSSGLVQICGKDICVNARVGDDGKLAEDVAQVLDDPACKFGDGLTWGKLAIQLDKGDTELGTLTTARLPDFADGVPFTPGTTISSGGVTLTLSADAHVEIDTLTYEDDSQRGFRAVELPEPALTQLKQDFVAGFALSPVDTRICPSPALSLENTENLAPGTALELYVLGVDVSEALTPYGEWQKVGEGQVSDDGATLDFPEGLPLLTAIGVREKG